MQNSEKHGFGQMTKYRASNDLKPIMDSAYKCTREDFFETVSLWVKKAQEMEQKARKKSNKVMASLM